MQLHAASPFFPAATWHRPQVSAAEPAELSAPTESVELSGAEAPSARGLAASGRQTATQAMAPLLGIMARATGGSCPYLQATPKVSSFEFARTVATHFDRPHEIISELHDRHGDSFYVDLPGKKPMLFDSRPEVMHQVLANTRGKKGEGTFEKSDTLAHGFNHLFGEQNVFTGTGPEWRSTRAMLEIPMRGNAIHTEDNVRHVADVFDRHLADLPEGEVDLRAVTQRAAMDSAFQVMFGAQLSRPELDQTLHAFAEVRRYIAAETLNPTSFSLGKLGVSSLDRAQETLVELADRMIAERKVSGQVKNDVLGTLLSSDLPHERVRHEVLTLMLAGHETTASLLSWAVMELAHHPDEQKRVYESLAPLEGRPPEAGKMQEQTGEVKGVVMETMRLHSPSYLMAREAEEDVQLGDTLVARGTTIVMSPLQSHRDQDAWGADAGQFRPGRFKGSTSKMFGLGGGTRICLGQNLARLESTVFLTRFLQKFEVAPVADLTAASDVSHHPKDARVRVHLR